MNKQSSVRSISKWYELSTSYTELYSYVYSKEYTPVVSEKQRKFFVCGTKVNEYGYTITCICEYFYKVDHKNFDPSFASIVSRMIRQRYIQTGETIEYGIMESALQESFVETGEYEYITYNHYKVRNRIIKLESDRGMKNVSIDYADTEEQVSYFDDDVNNNILCQSLFDDNTIEDIDKTMMKYMQNGYTMPEIARLLNTTAKYLNQRLYRLKKSLSYIINSDHDVSVITKSKKSTTAKITAYNANQVNNIMDMYLNKISVKDISVKTNVPCLHIRQIISRETKSRGNIVSKYIPVSVPRKAKITEYTPTKAYDTFISH